MTKILGKYKDDYEDIVYEDNYENGIYQIYTAYNKKNNSECCLKAISKEKLKTQNYDFILERINKEQEIQTLCNSANTVNFIRRLETEEYIIFELEYCEDNLNNYLQENGELNREKKIFKEIVVSIAKAIKTLHEKGIIHRDIKPHNIFIKNLGDDEDNKIIKLGNFNCAIKINENTSDSIGTFLYNAPEMIKDLEYDEKIDLWSLGITLYELYFGVLPYGPDANKNSMMYSIYDEKNFVLIKTFKKNQQPKIPTLDILFRRLLTMNPENRMTYNEFYDYVFSDDFMKEGVICINNNQKYKKIFDEILKEEFIEYYYPGCCCGCGCDEDFFHRNRKLINNLIQEENFPDIMNFQNANINDDDKFNNVIYYDENINYLSSIDHDSNYFERITPGAFILCTNMNSFKLIRDEILNENKKDKRLTFNLITTGSQCDNVMKFLNEDINFKKCIKNICVYCINIKKWEKLKNKYDLVYDVVTTKKGIYDFIKHFSSKEIKPYNLTKIITYNDYLNKYKDSHIKISQFYGDLTPEIYKENIEKNKLLSNQENKENKENIINKKQKDLLKGCLTFDMEKDLRLLDKLLLRDYWGKTYYDDNSDFYSYEIVAYLTSRFMYILNLYAQKKGIYYSLNETEVRKGIKIPYSSLLSYEKAKGKVILLSNFTSTTKEAKIAELFSGRINSKSLYNLKKRFSVILIIKNYYKKNWISNCITTTISTLLYKEEILVVYLPFSFFFVRDVQIDYKNYKADIYLETIGKLEILEEQIQEGKEIEYNKKENIMQVK